MLSASEPLATACLAHALDAATKMSPAPELVLSDNEPVDPEHYLRFGDFRVRRYENNLVIALEPDDDETPEQTLERWSDKIRSHVAENTEILRGYLRWRLGQIMARRSDRQQPRQVI